MGSRGKTGDALKTKILNTAGRLFHEWGYEKATYQMIADTLGISKGSISYYFPGKPWIVYEYYKRFSDAVFAYVRVNLPEGYNNYLLHCVSQAYHFRRIIESEPDRTLFSHKEHMALWEKENLYIIKEYFREITGNFHKDLSEEDLHVSAVMTLGAITSIFRTAINNSEDIEAERFCYYVLQMIGLFARLDEMTIQTNIRRAFSFWEEHAFPEESLLLT
ncbi:MAG: TetR/AcrR family transcriptional regulator [Oscillospiraceae bacterium]|jgi:AcrR family transcriptional regulator|nr:TetR/AcrR family transcriptional regulator [Oscillospiraceae bacterium]